ncbi:MAG: ornithine cyclodeaminase [Aminobacterium sp.]|jgi:2,3-diaminopropionate biosynthesis protein SbnB|nr:ornithine cyclodeaminase [Aminobacterium sp.]MDD3706902.1 ornithine cyclodeaminase [Aminobacterium sp.]MDD4228842.1 ornithine cyclodeaminase [Aminobacterium sp.]MDD4551039.1 ornithine cyclodeaminase [Aminobacterium sp.]
MTQRRVEFLYLTQQDVIDCGVTNMAMVMNKIEKLFSLRDKGETILPDKVALRWGDADSEAQTGRINAMPGYVGGDVDVAGIKWIASKPMNPRHYNMPRASALTILNNAETGFPLAVMDGTVISAMRTGAATGVAAKYLARKDSKVLCLIGAGTQNHTQMMAVKTALPGINEIHVYDISMDRVKAFIEKAREEVPDAHIEACVSAPEALKGADVIVSATTAVSPIVKAEWVEDGVFISNVGNYEYEFDVVRKAQKIVTDDWDGVIHRGIQTIAKMVLAGELSKERFHGNIGEIINGKKAARENDNEIIFYNAIGMGIEDIIVAKEIYDRALTLRKGQKLTLWEEPYWV